MLLAVRLVKVDLCVSIRAIVPVSMSIVSHIVGSVYCLSVLVSVKHTVSNKKLRYH